MNDPFVAPRWLANAHLQTLGAALPLWSSFTRPAELLRIPLPANAGALFARAWWQDGPRPAALIVHGVGGSSESRYVLRAGMALFRAGFHVIRLNLRGAGEGLAEAPSLYHGGLTEDVSVAIAALLDDGTPATRRGQNLDGTSATRRGQNLGDTPATRRGHQIEDVSLIGFSLGGNCALKLAGEWGAEKPPRVRAVAALSAPLDLTEVSRSLERGRNFAYRSYVLRNLIARGAAFARLHPSRAGYDVARLRRLRSLRAYDEMVVAPMHGFVNAADYYRAASSGPYLSKIRVPTLLVHAADDPMVPDFTVRPWIAGLPQAVEVAWSDRGGHLGWFAGLRETDWVDTWAMRRVLEFLRR